MTIFFFGSTIDNKYNNKEFVCVRFFNLYMRPNYFFIT